MNVKTFIDRPILSGVISVAILIIGLIDIQTRGHIRCHGGETEFADNHILAIPRTRIIEGRSNHHLTQLGIDGVA